MLHLIFTSATKKRYLQWSHLVSKTLRKLDRIKENQSQWCPRCPSDHHAQNRGNLAVCKDPNLRRGQSFMCRIPNRTLDRKSTIDSLSRNVTRPCHNNWESYNKRAFRGSVL